MELIASFVEVDEFTASFDEGQEFTATFESFLNRETIVEVPTVANYYETANIAGGTTIIIDK